MYTEQTIHYMCLSLPKISMTKGIRTYNYVKITQIDLDVQIAELINDN